MSHQVALSFEDGVTRFISCGDDQTVADASYRARINIPLDCRDGACGTCKARCESGEYDGGSYVDDALTEAEAAEGYCLPCQMVPRSDLVLQIASTSAVAKTQAATFHAKIVDITRYSPSTIGFTLEVQDRDKLAFLPGQYVNIDVPGTSVKRSYSFSSDPDEQQVSFLVKITPGGAMSTYLDERAAVGDEITFTGPNGSFFLRETDRPALLLAGGTGLAPMLSILKRVRTTGVQRPIHLVYGVNTDQDVVEVETLDALARDIPGFSWDYCVADPESSAPNKGYVTALLGDEHLHGGDVAVYLCGPPPMVEAVRSHFADTGLEPTGFYYEKFALAVPAEGAAPEARPAAQPAAQTSAPAQPATAPVPSATSLFQGPPPPAFEFDEETGVDPDVAAASVRVATESFAPPADQAGQWAVATDTDDTARSLMGGLVLPRADGPVHGPTALDQPAGELLVAPDGRSLVGQELHAAFPSDPLVTAAPAAPPAADEPTSGPTSDGYEIGEEHPSIQESDAIFEAREALELGALELTIARLDSRQLAGYRLLAEATVPYVDGDRFVDAAAYTETNAAFHDYLFTLTGNDHLLQAYQRLGVKGHMEDTLRHATWCHPLCTTDHLEIVTAFERQDRDEARRLIVEHAARSKETTRRAMREVQAGQRPAFISPGRFAGKVVLVTGAAQGIGERVARRVAAEGGQVVLADRSELVTALADELNGGPDAGPAGERGVPQALGVLADLETYAGAQSVVDAATERFGRVDVAIHNVGGAIWFKPFQEFTPEQIDAEVTRSLMTTLYSCRAVLPGMLAAGAGTIVNVSSIATGGIYRVPYAAAKGGVNAITRALAVEVAPSGVRVVATAPGGTEAPPRRIARGPAPVGEQEQSWFQAHIDQTLDSALLHRYGSLDEQAAAITFLASDEAAYITGTVLPVGGGDLG